MRISFKTIYSIIFILLGCFLIFLIYSSFHATKENFTQNSGETIEAKAIAQLGLYTSSKDQLGHLEYTVTNTIQFKSTKKISEAFIENLVITNGNFKDAKEFAFIPKHVLLTKERKATNIFEDDNIKSIDELERLNNVGYHLSFKVVDSPFQQFYDQIASTEENIISFRIKYYDFATSENLETNDFLQILKSANIDKSKMDTVVQYDILLQFSDGTSYSKHIKITIPGVNIGKNGSSGNIQYRERERDN